MTRPWSGRRKGHADRTARCHRERASASIGLGEITGIRSCNVNAVDGQQSVASIAERYSGGRAGCAHGRAGKRNVGGRQRDNRRKADSGKWNALRTTAATIGDADASRTSACGGRCESHANGAVSARRDPRAAGVDLRVVTAICSGDADIANRQSRGTAIAEHYDGGGTGNADGLIGKGEAGGREGNGCRDAGSYKGQRLRAAAGIIRDGEGSVENAGRSWREGDVDNADCSRNAPGATVVGLGKVRRGRNFRERQPAAGFDGKFNAFGGTAGIHRLVAESQAARHQDNHRSGARSRHGRGLRTVGRVVAYNYGSRESSSAYRGKDHANRAIRPRCHGSSASIGLRVVAGGCHAADHEWPAPGVGERKRLCCACTIDGLVPERQGCRRQADSRCARACASETDNLWAAWSVICNGNASVLSARSRRRKSDAYAAGRASHHRRPAGIRLGIASASGNRGDREC